MCPLMACGTIALRSCPPFEKALSREQDAPWVEVDATKFQLKDANTTVRLLPAASPVVFPIPVAASVHPA